MTRLPADTPYGLREGRPTSTRTAIYPDSAHRYPAVEARTLASALPSIRSIGDGAGTAPTVAPRIGGWQTD